MKAVRLLAVILVAAGCKSPTEPTKLFYRELALDCRPAGSDVQCTASIYDEGDVTTKSAWSSQGAPGTFIAPGHFVPSGRGEVAISARYQTFEPPLKTIFLVDPAAQARPLSLLDVAVDDAVTRAPITGVEVRILDGYATGRTAVTKDGFCRLERVQTGETFTVRVARSGYKTVEISHRIDWPPTFTAYLEIALQPQ